MSYPDIRSIYHQTRDRFWRMQAAGDYTNIWNTHILMIQQAPSADPLVNEAIIRYFKYSEGAECAYGRLPYNVAATDRGADTIPGDLLACCFPRDAFVNLRRYPPTNEGHPCIT
jgi:hypothetical protein